jgi:rRNA maturation protein Nop10
MSYYEPQPLKNLPGEDKVRYCQLISGLVLIHERVCHASGWRILSPAQGHQPQCGNEHCVLNCIDDEQIERQRERFALPAIAQRRPGYRAEPGWRRSLTPEDALQGVAEDRIFYTLVCYRCGRETVDEQPATAPETGFVPLDRCPECGSEDVERAYWKPNPAKTQAEARADYEAFVQRKKSSPPDEDEDPLVTLLKQLCQTLQGDPGKARVALEAFQSACLAGGKARAEEIEAVLQDLAGQEAFRSGSAKLLESLREGMQG